MSARSPKQSSVHLKNILFQKQFPELCTQCSYYLSVCLFPHLTKSKSDFMWQMLFLLWF